MTVYVLWLFLTMQWIGLHCVIVVSPDHTHLLLADAEACFLKVGLSITNGIVSLKIYDNRDDFNF